MYIYSSPQEFHHVRTIKQSQALQVNFKFQSTTMTEQGQYFTGYLEMHGRIGFEVIRANEL